MPGGYVFVTDFHADAIRAGHRRTFNDPAPAIQAYARQAKNLDAERHAAEIRMHGERRGGELLAEMLKAKGAVGNPGGQGAKIVPSDGARTQTLSDSGISYDQSSTWQQLAALKNMPALWRSGTGSIVLRMGLFAAALLETIAVAVHFEDVHVMSEPVEQGAGEAFGTKDLGPFLERVS
jgi:hypothetical protein